MFGVNDNLDLGSMDTFGSQTSTPDHDNIYVIKIEKLKKAETLHCISV